MSATEQAPVPQFVGGPKCGEPMKHILYGLVPEHLAFPTQHSRDVMHVYRQGPQSTMRYVGEVSE